MAEYLRSERLIRRVEYAVPAGPYGAGWAEVMKAVRAAHQDLWNAGVVPRDTDASDDRILLRPSDEAVLVYVEFEAEVEPEVPAS